MILRLKIVLPALLLIFCHSAFSQIQVVAEQDQDRNLTLISFNKSSIPYTIRIEFLKLENLESMEGRIIFAVAEPGKSILTKLRSIYVNEKTGFQYNTQLYKGNIKAISLDLPTYLPPVEVGKSLAMRPLTVSAQGYTTTPYAGVGFFVNEPVTVCAPRKGIVSEIQIGINNTNSGPSSWDTENYVELYHADGTFSRISGLAPGSAKVEVGDLVFPGQAIGMSSPVSDQDLHLVKMIQSRWEMGNFKMEWINFPVQIYISSQESSSEATVTEFTSQHPENLITQEMDKKELKRYLGK